MTKTKKLVTSVVACLMIVCTLLGVMTIPSAAAEEAHASVAELKGVTLRNVKTGEYLNFDNGVLKNGTYVRVWERDGSNEQLWDIKQVSGTTYRLLTHKSSKYALDVYRGNAKLKAGQKLDIWRAGEDTVAQNIVFYRCDDGSYVIRMAENTKLALSAGASGGRVKLAKLDTADKAQRWVFEDEKGRMIDPVQSATALAAISYVPLFAHRKSDTAYTVDGKTYHRAETLVTYNGVAAGTRFYLNEKGCIVTDERVLASLSLLENYESVRVANAETVRLRASAAKEYYELYVMLATEAEIAGMLGGGFGTALGILCGNSLSLCDVMLQVAGDISSPETLKAAILLELLGFYTNNTVAYANTVLALSKEPITDYDEVVRCVDAYAACGASHAVVDHLSGDEIRELANCTWWDRLTGYVENVFMGFCDSILPDLDCVAIVKGVTDGVVSLTEFAMKSGVTSVYDGALASVRRSLAFDGFASAEDAERLIEVTLDGSLGKTLAAIKKNDAYTKWYGKTGNVSACGGYTGQCTWYALGRFYEVTGVKLTKAPNAKEWLSTYKKSAAVKVLYGAEGIASGAIAVDTNGKYGHVLFVEAVAYDSNARPAFVYFTECNWDGNGVYNAGRDAILQKLSYSDFLAKKSPDGYIVAK